MTDSIKTFIWYFSTNYNLQDPILEIGSCPAAGQVNYADLHPFFLGKDYKGCDIIKGPGVDEIQDVEKLTYEDSSFSTILCFETLEHIQNPLKAMDEMYRVLKDPGIIVISTQMWSPVHFNIDYWRFTPQCIKEIILRKFDHKEILIQGQETFPHSIIAIAYKADNILFPANLGILNQMLPMPYPWPFILYP